MAERSRDSLNPVIEALRRWAMGHPRAEQPFLIVRGRAFTPKSFLIEAERQTEFGRPFLEKINNVEIKISDGSIDLIERFLISYRC
jgi:hypothetical protein